MGINVFVESLDGKKTEKHGVWLLLQQKSSLMQRNPLLPPVNVFRRSSAANEIVRLAKFFAIQTNLFFVMHPYELQFMNSKMEP